MPSSNESSEASVNQQPVIPELEPPLLDDNTLSNVLALLCCGLSSSVEVKGSSGVQYPTVVGFTSDLDIAMSGNSNCIIYIGNLDERVTERVLYDILIQAGRVVDLHILKDKESNKPKGFAFAEYETEEIADYAVRLFSGLVTLYNRTLKFAVRS